MYLHKLLMVTVLSASCCLCAFGQKKDSTGVKTITFGTADDSDSGTAEDPKEEDYVFNNRYYKLTFFDLLYGKQMFLVESELNKHISIQVGLGIVFNLSKKIPHEQFEGGLKTFEDKYSTSEKWGEGDVPDDYLNFDHRTRTIGQLINLQERYYIRGEGAVGGYFFSEQAYERRLYQAERVDETKAELTYLTDDFEREVMSHYRLTIGYGYQFLLRDLLVLDVNIGAGGKYLTGTRQDIGILSNGLYGNGVRSVTKFVPTALVEFRIGVNLN